MNISNISLSPKLFATAFGLILSSTAFSAPKGEQLIGPTGITAVVGRNQLQVLAVDEGSPAAGKLKKGDVIVGAGDGKFFKEVREQIASAIENAEGADLAGKLTLTLKGGTKTELQLKELGSFSVTAPWDCAKTNAIITRTADKMLETGDFRNGGVVVGWIGLMATGEDKYLDVIKQELPKQEWAVPQDTEKHTALLKGEIDMGYIGWYHNPTSSVAAAAMVLAKFDVKEGLEWSWAMLESPDGKAGFKARAILDILTAYGPSAKPHLDKIRADEKLTRLLSAGRWKGKYDAMVKAVESGEAEKLIPFEEAKKIGR